MLLPYDETSISNKRSGTSVIMSHRSVGRSTDRQPLQGKRRNDCSDSPQSAGERLKHRQEHPHGRRLPPSTRLTSSPGLTSSTCRPQHAVLNTPSSTLLPAILQLADVHRPLFLGRISPQGTLRFVDFPPFFPSALFASRLRSSVVSVLLKFSR